MNADVNVRLASNGSGISGPQVRPVRASAQRAAPLAWKCKKGRRPREKTPAARSATPGQARISASTSSRSRRSSCRACPISLALTSSCASRSPTWAGATSGRPAPPDPRSQGRCRLQDGPGHHRVLSHYPAGHGLEGPRARGGLESREIGGALFLQELDDRPGEDRFVFSDGSGRLLRTGASRSLCRRAGRRLGAT